MLPEIAPRLAGLLLMSLACPTAGAAPAAPVHRGSGSLERGLRGRGDVIFFCDFESDRWYEEWGLRKASRNSDIVSADPDRRFRPFAGKALRIKVAAGTHYGVGDLSFDFGNQLGREPEEVCFRYYLRLGADWEPVFGGKLPGVSGTYGRAGWGGRPSDGRNGWSARGLFERPRDGKTAIGYYCYHADMEGQYGSGWVWDRNRLGYLERDRWYCVEQYVRMNTPGRNDGVMRGWIDGRLAFEKTDVRMRDVAGLKIEKVWMNVYHGGKTPAKTDNHLYIDNVVVAHNYIGPAVFKRPERRKEPIILPDGTEVVIVGGIAVRRRPKDAEDGAGEGDEAAEPPAGDEAKAARRARRARPAAETPEGPEKSVEARRLLKDAEALFIDGELEDARRLFERVMKEHPGTPSAAKAREYLKVLEQA